MFGEELTSTRNKDQHQRSSADAQTNSKTESNNETRPGASSSQRPGSTQRWTTAQWRTSVTWKIKLVQYECKIKPIQIKTCTRKVCLIYLSAHVNHHIRAKVNPSNPVSVGLERTPLDWATHAEAGVQHPPPAASDARWCSPERGRPLAPTGVNAPPSEWASDPGSSAASPASAATAGRGKSTLVPLRLRVHAPIDPRQADVQNKKERKIDPVLLTGRINQNGCIIGCWSQMIHSSIWRIVRGQSSTEFNLSFHEFNHMRLKTRNKARPSPPRRSFIFLWLRRTTTVYMRIKKKVFSLPHPGDPGWWKENPPEFTRNLLAAQRKKHE